MSSFINIRREPAPLFVRYWFAVGTSGEHELLAEYIEQIEKYNLLQGIKLSTFTAQKKRCRQMGLQREYKHQSQQQ